MGTGSCSPHSRGQQRSAWRSARYADVRAAAGAGQEDRRMSVIEWPARWPDEAKEVLLPYFGSDKRLRIVVDAPASAIDGTVVEGYVYLEGAEVPTIIHDRSGRPDAYPWRLLVGPVLRIYELRPRRTLIGLLA